MPVDAAQSADSLTFEQALTQLEEIVAELEAGQLTLDESIALFERGVHLAKACGDRLAEAKLRITRIEEALEVSVLDDED